MSQCPELPVTRDPVYWAAPAVSGPRSRLKLVTATAMKIRVIQSSLHVLMVSNLVCVDV